ncbi:uncharacterized protein LOC131625078 [Vicia villosa]|uniref:uncharacterized protein LOC131625078 n=1 Tax=Vicia villosa TaxID=3911 RepID=UPI00273CE9B0|nr:uncharacterized protein LOC131625078 [Vicia villosa]
MVKEKLRLLKASLRRCNDEDFGRFDFLIEDGMRGINVADNLFKIRKEEEIIGLVKVRSEASSKMWLNMKVKKNVLLQKARVRWDREGDLNNKYFHSILKSRRRRNFIGSITTDRGGGGGEGIKFKSISTADKSVLEVQFSKEDIKGAVWGCEWSRSPGPDGYNLFFIILSKFLAARLKWVLGSIISESQSSFVPGRNLLDGVLVANEIVDYATKEKKGCLMFNVDFEKAYSKVNRGFLMYMLRRMGFGELWVKWMYALICNSWMSVLVNGYPMKDFEVSRDLRQRDPLLLFLFVIIGEGLSTLVKKAVEVDVFSAFNFAGNYDINILQFADDTLLVVNSNWKQV